jgi:hypothetical protein
MRTLIALLIALFAAPVHAGIWQDLSGHWRGEGEVSGMAAQIELQFRPALDGRGHHLSFSSRMRAKDGKQWPFAAEAFYLCDARPVCRGNWYDTRGLILPLTAASHADRLLVEWGDARTERGRTTYRLNAQRLEITDEVLGKDGEWKVFGRTTASRQED